MSSQVHPDPQPNRSSPRSAISNAIVRIHAKYYGRGPTKARTHMSDDYALVVLEEVFTPAEQTLIAAGQFEHVLRMRAAFQEALRQEFVEAVEAIAGRPVRAFLSQINQDPEMAVELFMFENGGNGDAEARADGAGPSAPARP